MNELDQAVAELKAQQGNTPQAPAAKPLQYQIATPQVQMRATELDDALKELKQQKSIEEQKILAPYQTLPQKALTAVEGASKGFAGPIATGAERLISEMGIPGLSPEEQELRQQGNPYIHGGSEALGFGAGMLTGTGEAGALSALGHLVPEAAPAAGLLSKIGTGAMRGGLEGMAFQAGEETSKFINGRPADQVVQASIPAIGLTGLITAGFGGAFGAVGHLWDARAGVKLAGAIDGIKGGGLPPGGEGPTPGGGLPGWLKTPLNTVLGISPETAEKYAANRELIRALPDDDVIYQHVRNHIADINELVENGKLGVTEAKEAFKEAQKTAARMFQERKIEASEAKKMAATALDKAQQDFASRALDSATNQAVPVAEAVEKLQQGIFQGSYDAADTLKGQEPLNIGKVYNQIDKFVNELHSESNAMSDTIAQKLLQQKEMLQERYGLLVDPENFKPIMKGLDKQSNYGIGVGEIEKNASPYFKQLRHTLDQELKSTYGDYASKMEVVDSDMRLLQKVKNFAEPDKAAKAIKGLTDPTNYKLTKPLLEQLEERTGMKFLDPITTFADPAVRERLAAAMPEVRQHRTAAEIEKFLASPEAKALHEKAIQESAEAEALKKSHEGFKAASEMKKQLSGITEANAEGAILKGERGKTFTLEQFAKFPELEGMPFDEVVKLSGIRSDFEKGMTNGSRNVNLWRAITAAMGAATGGASTGVLTGGAGGMIGAWIDKNGPSAGRKILDWYIDGHPELAASFGQNTSREAMRYGLSKALDSNVPVSAAGVKSASDLVQAAERGKYYFDKGVKSLFHEAVAPIPSHLMPSEHDIKKLDQKVKEFQYNPGTLDRTGEHVSYYMPEHGSSAVMTASNALSYLASLKPEQTPGAPLDKPMPISKLKQRKYENALKIAEQPLTIFELAKDKRLTANDMQHYNAMYPGLADMLNQHIVEHVAKAQLDGTHIDSQTKQMLSIMMHQPMDSVHSPKALQSNQAAFNQVAAANQQKEQALQGNLARLGGMKDMNKSGRMSLTHTDDPGANLA